MPEDSDQLAADPSAGTYTMLCVPDVQGSLRGKALRPAAFEAAAESGVAQTDLLLALDPVDTPITDLAGFGVRSGSGDLIVRPVPETLHDLAWRPGWRICLGTPFWRDGSDCALAPREVLRAALGRLKAQGFRALAAFEYEIRVSSLEGRASSSGISYSALELRELRDYADALVPALEGLGVELTAVHTEAAPGLLELNVAPAWGVAAADAAALLKFAAKDLAGTLGLRASFLAKPVAGDEGSSGHIHFSLWDETGNTFAGSPESEPAQPLAGAIAGVVEHLPAASLLLNPTINSYKRLVPGFFAPVNATWGIDNRSTAVRVIRSAMADRCRMECRRPGADANPYLALAGLIAAAGDGVARGATPPEAVVGDAYTRTDVPELPNSLESALAAFRADTTFRALLGTEFCEYFAVTRAWELRAWQNVVSDWERERYDRAV